MPLNIAAGASPVPGYELVKLLGEGGFGQVWEAEAPGGLRVAMKFIRVDTGQAESELRALDTIRHVRHPHLLDLHFALQVDNYLIIATSLCDMNLFDRFTQCREEGLPGIPPEELLRYMRESATAIDFLNEPRHVDESGNKVSIQHRDIKPLNLFLVGDSIKVADFGLAKVLSNRTTGHTGSLTPHYVAPERLDGQVSNSSDQYSLAVTYCELRTGTLPFDGSVYEVIYGHMNNKPDVAELSIGEQRVIRRALSKDPDDRWSSCGEFANQLKRSLKLGTDKSVADKITPQNVSNDTQASWISQAPAPDKPVEEVSRDSSSAASKTASDSKRHWSSQRRRRQKSRLIPFVALMIPLLLAVGAIAYVATDYGKVKINLSEAPTEIRLIELDGQELTFDELTQLKQLKSGSHQLKIVGDGFQDVDEQFIVQRGDNPDWEIEFVPDMIVVDNTKSTTDPSVDPEESSSRKTDPVVPEPVVLKPGVVKLTVNPNNAELVVLEGDAELKRNGRERILTVPMDESQAETKVKIAAKMDGYELLQRTLDITAGQTESVTFNLVPQPSVYEIEVTPKGARVVVEGLDSEVANKEQFSEVKIPRPDGTTPVTVIAKLDGYKSEKLQFVPKPGEWRHAELNLKVIPATLEMTVTPASATLSVDPERLRVIGNRSTRTLTIADPLQLKNVKITATQEGYESAEFSWEIKPGSNESHTFDLIPKPATLNVAVTPESAKLKVTPSEVKISSEENLRKLVVERPDRTQIVKVIASANGYESHESIWSPEPGGISEQTISLIPKPVTLTVTLEPDNAELFISPDGTTVTGDGPKKTISAKPSTGPFKIEARLDGFETRSLTWTPEFNKSYELRFKLESTVPSPLAVPFDANAAKLAQQEWAEYTKTKVVVTNGLGMEFVLIPPGNFRIGLPINARQRANAILAQKASVENSFPLLATEVTQSQWVQVMGTRPWSNLNVETGDDHPAVNISWEEANKFCRRLTQIEALRTDKSKAGRYRLPTEAEWEWACRAGSADRYTCPENQIDQHAWFADNTRNGNIRPVAKLKANPFGLYDMHGNVSEWCKDIYGQENAAIETRVANIDKGILRGGSWNDRRTEIQSTARVSFSRDRGSINTGFRIVKTD